jgi:hypothetical protein
MDGMRGNNMYEQFSYYITRIWRGIKGEKCLYPSPYFSNFCQRRMWHFGNKHQNSNGTNIWFSQK